MGPRQRSLTFSRGLALCGVAASLAIGFPCAPVAAADDDGPAPSYRLVAKKLSEFVQAESAAKNLPAVSIALVDDDQLVWSAGFNAENPATGAAATGSTVYRVGSVSKLLTDMALMQLVADGKVDLDAPVSQYLPQFQPNNPFDEAPTVRQLTSHLSGIVREPPVGSYFDPDEPSVDATVASLNDTALVHQPGTVTKYSNAAVTVAGLIVEKVAGKPFEEYVQQALLAPMQMRSSSFRRTAQIDQRTAQAWMWTRHLPRFAAPRFELATIPAGNLYASAQDLGNFLITILCDGRFDQTQVLPAEAMQDMLRPTPDADGKPTDYGIGFRLGELDGYKTFSHGGAVYGYSTLVIGLPEEKLGVVAVVALDGGDGFIRRVAEHAVRLMLAQRAGQPLPELRCSEPLEAGVAAQLAGLYANGDQTIRVQADNHRAFLSYNSMSSELRVLDGQLVVDDAGDFGTIVEPADDYGALVIGDKTWNRIADERPDPCPDAWRGLIGEYGWNHNVLYIYEDRGTLWALIEWFYYYPLTEVSENEFAFPNWGLYPGERIVFARDDARADADAATAAGVRFPRRSFGAFADGVFNIRPTRPVEQLTADALAAEPPGEVRPRRTPDLVEPASMDPTIKLDIRYAGTRNFLQTRIYDSARAFLQRPAAEAVVRVHQALAKDGYGLLIHDAYRPWYVTKVFWDGTPDEFHDFVADPAEGSRHNRGCAVDLTLYDLKTGAPVTMVGAYDEFSPRSYPLYPGDDARQRWHRDLLRRAMEREGFTVFEAEWWHFDFRDWREYPIVNLRFEQLQANEP